MRKKYEYTNQHGEAITIDFSKPSAIRKTINLIKNTIL